jgi:hypothetical protein
LLVGIAQVFAPCGVESESWAASEDSLMSKFFKVFAIIGVLAGAMAATSGTALAQHHHGGGGGGGWHHGGGGGFHGGGFRRGGFGPGFGFGLGFGSPYYYGGPYYDDGPACGYTRVRLWRNGHWVLRRAWRCY